MKLLVKSIIATALSFSPFVQATIYTVTGDIDPKIVAFDKEYIRSLPAQSIQPLMLKLHELFGDDFPVEIQNIYLEKIIDMPVFSQGNIALVLVNAVMKRGGTIVVALQLSSRNQGQLRLIPYFTTHELSRWGTVISPKVIQEVLDQTASDRPRMKVATQKLITNFPAKFKKDITNSVEDMINNVIMARDLEKKIKTQ